MMKGGYLLLSIIYLHGRLFLVCGAQDTRWRHGGENSDPACNLTPRKSFFHYKVTQDGDVSIGAILSIHYVLYETKTLNREPAAICMFLSPQYYRHFLAFIYAVDEINKSSTILPNISLGYHVYDSCCDVKRAIEGVLSILSGLGKAVPNYSCRKHENLVGFIGDLSSTSSLAVSHVLGVYGYPQISYGFTNPLPSGKEFSPSFFQAVQDDHMQYLALSCLLVRFGWTWVGIITSDDESGEAESQALIKEMTEHNICIEFTFVVKQEGAIREQLFFNTNNVNLEMTTANIIIICGSVSVLFLLTLECRKNPLCSKTIILSSSWTFSTDLGKVHIDALNGSLIISTPRRHIPGLTTFLESVHPSRRPGDTLLEDLWIQYFKCFSSNLLKNEMFQMIYSLTLSNCTGTEHIVDISEVVYDTTRFRTTYHVYTAVYVFAHALHNIQHPLNPNKESSRHRYKALQCFIKHVRFIDPIGEEIYFTEKGGIPTKYHINNHVVLENGIYLVKRVGQFSVAKPGGLRLFINTSDIVWKRNTAQAPQSRCSENCNPGYRKVLQKGRPVCCFACVQCSEGEITGGTDFESCQLCPETQWPNERRDTCLPKTFEFLSYETDLIASAFSFFSIFFSATSGVVLMIFIVFRDTPLVKANNRNLSFILLISLSLSFLCVFFYIGRPVDVTCMLRHTSFGIVFTVAVSSVLAKTVIVGIAFKATKPGNTWNKWAGYKMGNTIVILCSFLQVLICISWLVVSPPFQDVNTKSIPGKIILKCNEGSSFAFYCVLGYTGLLAALSFVVAFLVRTLPDSFNEGKYITFSMLVFCCVWVCVVPAYLSTAGKNMVATEIFAILASTAGLLTCIFFPKCYIILIRPERNTRRHILSKMK